MTPEERASAVVRNFTGDHYWIDTDAAIIDVTAAIRAAVTVERERCAKLAEETTRQPMDYIGWSPGPAADDRARSIADAIRTTPA